MERNKNSLFTEAKICIDQLVKTGRTILFDDRNEAEQYAHKRNTYVYSAVDKKGYFQCFAVPNS